MAVIYKEYYNQDPDKICVICRDPLSQEQRVLAHEGNGHLHPVHETCVKIGHQFLVSKCPTCFVDINMTPLFSLRERCIHVLSNDGIQGALCGVATLYIPRAAGEMVPKEWSLIAEIVSMAVLGRIITKKHGLNFFIFLYVVVVLYVEYLAISILIKK